MPVPAEEFIEDKIAKKVNFQGNNQKEILTFLQEHYEEAYTQTEIQQRLGIRHAPSVNASLHSLHLRGLIRCKNVSGKHYWCAEQCQKTISQ